LFSNKTCRFFTGLRVGFVRAPFTIFLNFGVGEISGPCVFFRVSLGFFSLAAFRILSRPQFLALSRFALSRFALSLFFSEMRCSDLGRNLTDTATLCAAEEARKQSRL